jgi:hypothetical protein
LDVLGSAIAWRNEQVPNNPQRPREGFVHKGLIVYALQYALATGPTSWLIVWLDEQGNSVHPWVRAAEPGKRIVTVKPGDKILHDGKEHRVAAVTIYRALGVEPGREVVG